MRVTFPGTNDCAARPRPLWAGTPETGLSPALALGPQQLQPWFGQSWWMTQAESCQPPPGEPLTANFTMVPAPNDVRHETYFKEILGLGCKSSFVIGLLYGGVLANALASPL